MILREKVQLLEQKVNLNKALTNELEQRNLELTRLHR